MSVVGDLYVALGFKVDDSKLKSFDQNIKSLRNNFLGLVAETAGAIYAVDRFNAGLKNSLTTAQSLSNFTKDTGLNNYKLQIFEATGRMGELGIKTEETLGAFQSLNAFLIARRYDGTTTVEMMRLGVTTSDNADSAVEKIRNARQNNPQYSGEAGKALFSHDIQGLGLDQRMGPEFDMSWQEQEKKALATGTIRTEDQINAEQKLNATLAETTIRTDALYNTIALKLAPALEGFNNKLVEILNELNGGGSPDAGKKAADWKKFWQNNLEDNQKPRSFWNRVGRDAAKVYGFPLDVSRIGWEAITGTGDVEDSRFGTTSMLMRDKVLEENQKKLSGAPSTSSGALSLPTSAALPDGTGIIQTPQPSASGLRSLNNLPIDGAEPVVKINGDGDSDWDKAFKNLQNKPSSGTPLSSNSNFNIKIDVNGADSPRETAQEINRQLEYAISLNQFGNGGVA